MISRSPKLSFFRLCKVAAVAAVIGAALPNPVQAASIGSRPANPDPNNPRTQSIFIYNLDRGGSKTDQIVISNGSNEQTDIEVYPVDGVVTVTGDFTCRQQVEPKKDAGNWVKMSKNEVSLAPGASTKVDFTVNVPDKADVGEHNACLVVQRKTDPNAAKQTGGIQLQTRQAIRMAITIPGDIHRDISIDKFTATGTNGQQSYDIAIKNSGNVSADVDVRLKVRDMMGNVVYENGGEYAAIADEVRQFRYESKLESFWGGKYKAELSISYNKKAGEWGVSKNSGDLITKSAEPIELFFWPTPAAWGVIAGGLLILVLVVWRLVVAAKRRKPRLRRR